MKVSKVYQLARKICSLPLYYIVNFGFFAADQNLGVVHILDDYRILAKETEIVSKNTVEERAQR